MKTSWKNKVLGLSIIAIVLVSCEKDNTVIDTTTRNDYVGSWTCTETPVAKNLYFDCIITIDANTDDNIKLQNFASLNATAFAIVSGKSVILPKQTLNGNTIEGYGTMNNKDYISWSYYVKDNTDSVMYNTNFNRK
jgi:hypothetical protein